LSVFFIDKEEVTSMLHLYL